MELKSYFKKYGNGWVIVGFLVTVLVFYLEWLIEYAGQFPYAWIEFSLVSISLGFVPFMLAFFGLFRLFWLLIGGVFIFFLLLFLEISSKEGSWSLIITIPLLIILSIIGIIWEILHYYYQKN